MTPEEILDILLKCYTLSWEVREKYIGLPDRGMYLNSPIKDEVEVRSIAHLLMQRYEDRKRITINKLDIQPDMSAPTQESLLANVGAGTIWRYKKRKRHDSDS